MTPIARLKACGPCDLAIVTNAAKLSFLYRIHGDFIGACFHFEWRWMAGVTFVPDPVKPMWKDGRRYSSLSAFPFETYVSVHGERYAEKKNCQDKRREDD